MTNFFRSVFMVWPYLESTRNFSTFSMLFCWAFPSSANSSPSSSPSRCAMSSPRMLSVRPTSRVTWSVMEWNLPSLPSGTSSTGTFTAAAATTTSQATPTSGTLQLERTSPCRIPVASSTKPTAALIFLRNRPRPSGTRSLWTGVLPSWLRRCKPTWFQ